LEDEMDKRMEEQDLLESTGLPEFSPQPFSPQPENTQENMVEIEENDDGQS